MYFNSVLIFKGLAIISNNGQVNFPLFATPLPAYQLWVNNYLRIAGLSAFRYVRIKHCDSVRNSSLLYPNSIEDDVFSSLSKIVKLWENK